MRVILATQGSQGVVALRELFGLGYKPNQITILICKSGFNSALWEFLEFNRMNGLEIQSSNEFDDWLEKEKTTQDATLLSISWKYKFSRKVISRFGNRAINLHPGLLPMYRGCFSTPWAIINGEEFSGYTYHVINENFDCGGILLQEKIKIHGKDTAHSLNYRIMQRALSKIGEVLDLSGADGEEQFECGAYYKNEIPFGGKIQPDWSSQMIERFTRAMYFPPHDPAYELIDGKKLYRTVKE